MNAGSSLFRIEVTVGPGSGVKILNHPVPPAFRESVRYAEQNLYTRSKEIVGDRDPRGHEFSIQLLAIEKGAETVLIPVSARKQLFELSDDMATKVNILFYSDVQDALIKSFVE